MNKFGRSRAFVSFLGMVLFSLPLTSRGEAGGPQITSEQVSQAVREIKKVCTSEIEQDAVPGTGQRGDRLPTRLFVQTYRFHSGRRTGRREKNLLGLENQRSGS